MFFVDLTNPLTLLLLLAATILLIFLAQEVKKSYIAAMPLVFFLLMIVGHVAQLLTLSEDYRYLLTALSMSITIDFIFILITFFGYLWVDDIDAKENNKKSVDNSLDWFWKNV